MRARASRPRTEHEPEASREEIAEQSPLHRGSSDCDMVWSVDQDGVLTQFDAKAKRIKQTDYLRGDMVRLSRGRFADEATAASAFGRRTVAFDLWPPLIRPKAD
jgi:hypothetical protein